MRKENLIVVMLAVVISTAITVGLTYAGVKKLSPKIVTVDLQSLVEEHDEKIIASLGTGENISDAQREVAEKLSVGFAKGLSQAVDELGRTCNCILVNKAALLTSGTTEDYTDLLREQVK